MLGAYFAATFAALTGSFVLAAVLTLAAKRVTGPVTLHWLESADHGYRPLKASGRTTDDVLAEVAETSVTWVRSLRVPVAANRNSP